MNLTKEDIKKKAADALKKQPADGKKRKATGSGAVLSPFNLVKESNGDGHQYCHDSGVMEQSHDLDVLKQSRGYLVCSSATAPEDELSGPVIVRCVKPGDAEIGKEIDSVKIEGAEIVKEIEALKKQPADGKKRKTTGYRAVQSRFNLVKESNGDGQQYCHDSGVMEQSHDLDVMKQSHGYLVCSSATGPEDELSSPVIVRCVKPGDVEIVKEIDGVVYLKEYSGEEVRLDPAILFANVSEADRSRLLKVFARRPDTFMRMGSLGSFFIRFALESFSRMWGMLESTKIADLSEEELDDLLKSFGDMQRCLIKTDWLEALFKRMGRLKKARMINIDREKARAEIQELEVLLSRAEEKKHQLDEEAQALGAISEEDIPVIVPRCVKPGDVEIVKEIDGVVYLKEYSGEEVRLDPAILFANISEADRSRLLKVFARRPDTFMRMGRSLGSFFIRFALESFSRMWGMLESTKVADLSEEELDDLLKSFGDMQRCLIKTDWIEAIFKQLGRLKKASMINTDQEKARAEIQELKVLLSRAEEKKHQLDEEAQALGAISEEDISLEWSVAEGLFAGRKTCGKRAGDVQNPVKKRKRGEGSRTGKGGEEGWEEWQRKDKRKGRRISEGISFAGKGRYGEGASGSENFSLVLMAGGTPTAVLVGSPSLSMDWEVANMLRWLFAAGWSDA